MNWPPYHDAVDDSVKRDLAALLDATRHDDLGPEIDAVRARLEAWLHTEPGLVETSPRGTFLRKDGGL